MREDVRDMLADFPDILHDNDDFLTLLVKMDKAINISKDLDKITAKCQTFDEVKLVLDIYRLVRVVNTTPGAYGTEYPTVDGLPYIDYLETKDELLFLEYERCVSNEDINILILEMDNCAQFLIQIINDHKTDLFQLNEIRNTIDSMNMMTGGISKYLLYILKLFKAYSVDFITDGNILNIDEDFNYQLNLDNLEVRYDIEYNSRWNMSQYDWLETSVDGKDIKEINFNDYNSNTDSVFLKTPFGDVKISN